MEERVAQPGQYRHRHRRGCQRGRRHRQRQQQCRQDEQPVARLETVGQQARQRLRHEGQHVICQHRIHPRLKAVGALVIVVAHACQQVHAADAQPVHKEVLHTAESYPLDVSHICWRVTRYVCARRACGRGRPPRCRGRRTSRPCWRLRRSRALYSWSDCRRH